MSPFLKVYGTFLVDGEGQEVILRGAGLGGWMNMENFITGYPGRECQIREALTRVLGETKSSFFLEKFLEYFFTESDAKFFKSLGLNCIRLPFNYHHFEDDMNPRILKKEGFKHLDRVIELCAQHGIWTVLDLHCAPGGQNQGWHSDNRTHHAAFWDHRDFQDRAVWLWEKLAERYKDNPWVAGYNPLNEPADSQHTRLIGFYNRVYTAIRKIDPDHVLFLDGNTFAADFSQFGDAHMNWSNTVVARKVHSQRRAKGKTTADFRKKETMDDGQRTGEWGPVFARKRYDGDATDEINQARFQVLTDQLQIYERERLSWSIWLFKDVDGFQGMVYSSPESPYAKLFSDFLAKKQRMAIDTWGTDETHVKDIYGPLEQWIKDNVHEKHQKLYPTNWTTKRRVAELSRHILIAEYLVDEWAEHFRGKSEDELDRLASSFSFENCIQREELHSIFKEYNSENL